MVIADYYHPDRGCLVDFFCNPGLKNCWHGVGLNPQPLIFILSQEPLTTQPRQPVLFILF